MEYIFKPKSLFDALCLITIIRAHFLNNLCFFLPLLLFYFLFHPPPSYQSIVFLTFFIRYLFIYCFVLFHWLHSLNKLINSFIFTALRHLLVIRSEEKTFYIQYKQSRYSLYSTFKLRVYDVKYFCYELVRILLNFCINFVRLNILYAISYIYFYYNLFNTCLISRFR